MLYMCLADARTATLFSTLSAMTANDQAEEVLARFPRQRRLASSREIDERRTCELCHAMPARDRAPNLTGHQLGPPVCRRCGATVRNFIVRAKALEGMLIQERQHRSDYLRNAPRAPHTAAAKGRLQASGVPTEDRILRGLVTLNAAWRCSLVARAGAPVTPAFSRPELTGLYSSLRAYKRSRNMVAALAADGVLTTPSHQQDPSASYALDSRPEADATPKQTAVLYTLGEGAHTEIEGLLSACQTLRVDAHSVLGEHLAGAREYATGNATVGNAGCVRRIPISRDAL